MHHPTRPIRPRISASLGQTRPFFFPRFPVIAELAPTDRTARPTTDRTCEKVADDQACATPPHVLDNLPIGANPSTNVSTGIYGLRFVERFAPVGGDCPTHGEEWHTPGADGSTSGVRWVGREAARYCVKTTHVVS